MAETSILRSPGIIRNASPGATSARPHAVMSGALPVVNVNMNAGGPQQQGGQQVRQGVTILPPKAGTRAFSTGGLPNQPAKQSVVIMPLPPKEQFAAAPTLTADQLLLCRHLADKYLDEQRALESATSADNIKLAEAALSAIDATMTAMTAAAAIAAAQPTAPQPAPQPAQPQPQRVVGGPRSSQAGAFVTPRRVPRPGPPPPPITITMDAGQPVITDTPPDTAGV